MMAPVYVSTLFYFSLGSIIAGRTITSPLFYFVLLAVSVGAGFVDTLWFPSRPQGNDALAAGMLILALGKRVPFHDAPAMLTVAAFALFMAGTALFFSARLNVVFQKMNVAQRIKGKEILILAAAMVFWGTVYVAVPALRHWSFHSEMVDLGSMDQAMWNTIHGRILVSTSFFYGNITRFAGHCEPIFLLIAPLYVVWASPYVLMAVQSAFAVSGAIVLYRMAIDKWNNQSYALVVALAYLSYPALNLAVLFDFHADPLALPFLLGVIAQREKKGRKFWICAVCALSCKEYAAFSLFGIGMYVLIFSRFKVRGVALAVISVCWFITYYCIIAPKLNPSQVIASVATVYSSVGGETGIKGIAGHFMNNPLGLVLALCSVKNMENIVFLLCPLFFLPLCSPLVLCAALPVMMKDLITGLDIGLHHGGLYIPFFFWAVVEIDKTIIMKYGKRLFIALLVAAAVSHFLIGESPLSQRFWNKYEAYYKRTDLDTTAENLIRMVPDTASVVCSGRLAPHLTHREFCYVPPRPADLSKVSFAVFDTVRQRSWEWCSRAEMMSVVRAIDGSGQWKKIFDKNGMLGFKKRGNVLPPP
jgi:uncharacterized membrane protein